MRKDMTLSRVLVAIFVVVLGACQRTTETPAVPAPTTSVTSTAAVRAEPFDIAMVSFAGYAPLYIAKEKGFFGDLDVRLHRIEDIASIRAGIGKKELEAYLATPDIALDNNTRAPGRAVWAIDESTGADGVVVSSEIRNVADLRGRNIAAEPGFPPYFVLLYVLHENGMSRKDVRLQDLTTQNAATAFTARSVDAAAIYEPYLSQTREQRKGSRVLLSSKDTPGLIVDLIFTREDVIASRPQDVEQLISGWNKALQHINAHREESYAIMAKAFDLPLADFEGIASGIRWLGPTENEQLIGKPGTPGSLYGRVDQVVAVLRRNRPEVFPMASQACLTSEFVGRVTTAK